MSKPMKHRIDVPYVLSTIISRMFDPFLVLMLVTAWMISESSLPMESKYIFIGIVIGVMIVPPVLLLVWAIAKKHIDNWDISDRHQRPIALLILFMLGFINILIVQTFGDATLTRLFIAYQIWIAGFLAITLLWKISGHTGTIAFAAGLLITKLGWEWWWVILPVILVGIARVIRKNHTPAQAIAGMIYSASIVMFAHMVKLL